MSTTATSPYEAEIMECVLQLSPDGAVIFTIRPLGHRIKGPPNIPAAFTFLNLVHQPCVNNKPTTREKGQIKQVNYRLLSMRVWVSFALSHRCLLVP